jgi:hypothetical protein
MSLKNRQHQKARREQFRAAAGTTPAAAAVPEATAPVVAPSTSASPTAADVSEVERRERIFATHAHIARRNYALGAGIRAGMTEAAASK